MVFLINLLLNQNITIFNTPDDTGLFSNDLHFFYSELFFIVSIAIFLIFFVIISNKKVLNGKYLNVSDSILNLFLFTILILILLANNTIEESFYIFNGLYYSDLTSVFFKNLLLVSFFVFVFAIRSYVNGYKSYDFEFILVLFISLFSSTLVLNSNDLLSLFFIIELQSLSFYILVSSKQTSSFSTESGLKYFIVGCFSSGIILFGISLIYGFTGLLSYSDLSIFLSNILVLSVQETFVYNFAFNGFIAGLVLFTIGFLFKFGAVPFHMWMPDAYEGSPFLITAYLSTIPKISLMYIFFKLYYIVFVEVFLIYQFLFIFCSILSLVLGSIAAIYQIKIKRLLTYSMITNTGYLLLGLSIGEISGIYVTLFYLISYIFIMIGLFFCFLALRERTSGVLIKKITGLINLFEINSFLAFSIFILLFSIAGIPPLLGFYSKFFLFMFSIKLKLYWLAILFVFFSAISVFYYIRLVKLIYFNRSNSWIFFNEISFGHSVVISIITLLNCLFFVNPGLIFKVIYNISLLVYI